MRRKAGQGKHRYSEMKRHLGRKKQYIDIYVRAKRKSVFVFLWFSGSETFENEVLIIFFGFLSQDFELLRRTKKDGISRKPGSMQA
jgi:hypothetical protein